MKYCNGKINYVAAAEQQYTDTPILIKIYKLLINELAHQLEEAQFLTVPTNGHSQVMDLLFWPAMALEIIYAIGLGKGAWLI